MHTPTPLPRAYRLLPLGILLAAAALLLGAAASYARVTAPTRPHDWPDFAVVTASLDQYNPAVGDGYIVWGDDRDHPLNDFDLYAYDVALQQVFPLVVEPLLQDQPATSGDWVVYRQGTNVARQYQLRAIRISTRQIITIAGGASNPINADISGDYVVWQDVRSGYNIYGYNLATNQEFTVTTALGNQFAPRISGNIVVWQDLRNVATTGWDIYGFNISTQQEFTVTRAPGDQWQPDISGNIVAWHDYRNDINGSDIYAANLTTRQEFPVAVYTGTQETSRVSGNWIVWSDSRNDPFNFDIYGYNVGTGVEYPINTIPTFQNSPDISGTLVAWQDYRNVINEADVYAANIPLDPATATPGGATATATATRTAVATAGATATPCTISFSDVDPNNPFYAFIRCLACRQIVSGYSDGTFRWGNDVTRGQLSKIIAGAAGLINSIPSTQQTFEDVPSSNAFWVFIERLSGVGAISGYACGGPGEPCVPPGNWPYFRWGANATRGQIAKITAVTAGWNGPIPTTQQTFEDVPPSNPFWTWIEELSSRSVISGYTCGGVGEPCVPPGNRPYFRWGANATRGQLSKIAAQSFFPNCQTPTKQ